MGRPANRTMSRAKPRTTRTMGPPVPGCTSRTMGPPVAGGATGEVAIGGKAVGHGAKAPHGRAKLGMALGLDPPAMDSAGHTSSAKHALQTTGCAAAPRRGRERARARVREERPKGRAWPPGLHTLPARVRGACGGLSPSAQPSRTRTASRRLCRGSSPRSTALICASLAGSGEIAAAGSQIPSSSSQQLCSCLRRRGTRSPIWVGLRPIMGSSCKEPTAWAVSGSPSRRASS
mmetsp:Transcript_65694/g.211983  ORF Transcript_65694/g.211983 Transcript_65694/m.211983 type:complete len:233 (-) Transcript_65694:289-987(-)